jgi:hypothetical protein
LVQLIEQGAEALVQLGQREEGVMAQPRQDPPLDDLNTDLRLGLLLSRQLRVVRIIKQSRFSRSPIRFIPCTASSTSSQPGS